MEGRKEGIITLFGSDSKVGTTMVSQSLGKIMAKQGKNVLMILQGNCKGFEYCDFPKEDVELMIDKTIGAIGHQVCEFKAIQPQIIKKDNASYLLLATDERTIDDLSPKQVVNLLLSCREKYQYVIYDGGSHFDNGAAIGSMEIASKVISITTQQQKSLDRLELLAYKILEPLNIEADLIINKYVEGSYGRVKEIAEIGKWNRIITLPYIPYGWDCECGHTTLLRYPKYNERIKAYEKTV